MQSFKTQNFQDFVKAHQFVFWLHLTFTKNSNFPKGLQLPKPPLLECCAPCGACFFGPPNRKPHTACALGAPPPIFPGNFLRGSSTTIQQNKIKGTHGEARFRNICNQGLEQLSKQTFWTNIRQHKVWATCGATVVNKLSLCFNTWTLKRQSLHRSLLFIWRLLQLNLRMLLQCSLTCKWWGRAMVLP